MQVKAVQLGQAINLKSAFKVLDFKQISKEPYLYEVSANSWIAVLRYGVIVFGNVKASAQTVIIDKIRPFVDSESNQENWEVLNLKVGPKYRFRLKNGVIYCSELELGVKQLISIILARSVVLEFLEKQTDEILAKFSDIIETFHQKGRIFAGSTKLLKLVGASMKIKNDSIYQLSMLDKPDFTWDDAQLDILYTDLEEEYEISSRYRILRDKINTLFEDSHFILQYLEGRRALLLEFIIVVLIVIEIILFFYE